MPYLRKNEKCPVHGGYLCCGRAQTSLRNRHYRLPVEHIPDPHHPRGYRVLRTPGAMRELLKVKVKQQDGLCFYCHKPFDDFRQVTPDHIDPRGMGAARRDDHEDNIVAACRPCNMQKGSKRIA